FGQSLRIGLPHAHPREWHWAAGWLTDISPDVASFPRDCSRLSHERRRAFGRDANPLRRLHRPGTGPCRGPFGMRARTFAEPSDQRRHPQIRQAAATLETMARPFADRHSAVTLDRN